jgi:GNAT superfamily N-acetyltransferase
MISVDELESAGFNAWPAFQQLLVAGWLLRFAEGYTKRANSANFLYPSTTPLDQLVPWCEKLYTARNLPPIFRLVDRAETPPVDRFLAGRGYRATDPSVVLQCPMAQLQLPAGGSDTFTLCSLDTWMPIHAAASRAGAKAQELHRRILAQVMLPQVLGVILADGQAVACGMGSVDRGLFGLFDLVTHPAHRRRGYGTQLIAGLIGWARERGATTCYLQVVQDNHPARALYHKLGFREAYRYWYRVLPPAENTGSAPADLQCECTG